jgi:hypothetical protein
VVVERVRLSSNAIRIVSPWTNAISGGRLVLVLTTVGGCGLGSLEGLSTGVGDLPETSDGMGEAGGAPEDASYAERPFGDARVDGAREAAGDAELDSDAPKDAEADGSTCTDHEKDGAETDVDCGGSDCGPCSDGLGCLVGADCKSAKCGADKKCALPTCADGVKNGSETGIDCGGPCTAACTAAFMVIRVGDGSAALTSASFPVFLERRYFSMAPAVRTIPLPIGVSGSHQPLTLAGTTPRDGALSLSADGRYATMLGYGAPPGTPSISGSAAPPVSRIVGRIDADDNVDTSTVLTTAFNGNNARSAVSVDGSAFWVGGASNTSGGIHYITFGTTGGTRILDLPNSVRATVIFGGQLYGSSGDTPSSGVFTVGAGLPTAAGQTARLLPGMPASGQSPCSFVIFDRDAAVPGPDTAYVADDRSPLSGGGIQKWTFNGTTWLLAGTFNHDNAGATLTVGMRGLTGTVTGSFVTLVATSADVVMNRLFMYVDDGSSLNPTPTLLTTAAANTVYRGVALAP